MGDRLPARPDRDAPRPAASHGRPTNARVLPAAGLLLLALAAGPAGAPSHASTLRADDLLVPAADEVAIPDGFRMEDYRGPVPQALPGGRAIGTEEAAALFEGGRGVVWVDVLPAPRRPAGLPTTSLWRPSPRRGVPGSLWLPDVGHGALSPETEGWFRAALVRATEGDRERPVVFYCLADCWMSWNAARRAIAWGWRQVLWYREGTDGWEAAGLPTEVLHPPPDAPP